METVGLNPASDLIQWEPDGNLVRLPGIHIDIDF